jgi:hypothetical protein
MEAKEFVTAIRKRVIESDHTVYQDLLKNTTIAKDPIWKEILPIYKGMTKEQQKSFLLFFRMIQVNTVSHILGILDGSSYLNENQEDFVLTTKNSDNIINGFLQDIFLEMEE